MFKRHGYAVGILYSIPILISLTFHAYLGSLSRFIADDFCSVSTIQRLGYLRSLKFWYVSWNGRFANSIIDGLLYLLGANRVFLIVPCFLAAWLLVSVLAAAWALPARLTWKERLSIAIPISSLILFVTLLLSPAVQQSLYWWGGLRAYTVSLFFISIYILAFQVFCKWEQVLRKYAFLYYAISFSIAFFTAGFNETLSPAWLLFTAGLVVLGIWTQQFPLRSKDVTFLLFGLLGALIGLIVLVIAPGNAIRLGYFHRSGIMQAFQIAITAYGRFLFTWLGGLAKFLGLVALGMGGFWAGLQIEPSGKSYFRYGLLFMGFGAILAFVCFLPAAYTVSSQPPERALIIPTFFLVLGITFGSYLWGQGFQIHFAWTLKNLKIGISVLLVVLVTVAVSLNVSSMYLSRSIYIQYAQKWDAMDAYVRAEKLNGKVKVRIAAKQNWVGLDEPRNRAGFWVNICMTDYYGVQILAPASGQP